MAECPYKVQFPTGRVNDVPEPKWTLAILAHVADLLNTIAVVLACSTKGVSQKKPITLRTQTMVHKTPNVHHVVYASGRPDFTGTAVEVKDAPTSLEV